MTHAPLAPVIAHRGASGDAPENTLSALQLAAVQGARCVEIDVPSALMACLLYTMITSCNAAPMATSALRAHSAAA